MVEGYKQEQAASPVVCVVNMDFLIYQVNIVAFIFHYCPTSLSSNMCLNIQHPCYHFQITLIKHSVHVITLGARMAVCFHSLTCKHK